jgi:hypothetical protein
VPGQVPLSRRLLLLLCQLLSWRLADAAVAAVAAAEVNPQEHGEVWLAGSHHQVYSSRPALTELSTGDLGKAYGNW